MTGSRSSTHSDVAREPRPSSFQRRVDHGIVRPTDKVAYPNTAGAAKSVTMTNTSPKAVAIASIALTGTPAGQFAETNNCGKVLPSDGHPKLICLRVRDKCVEHRPTDNHHHCEQYPDGYFSKSLLGRIA